MSDQKAGGTFRIGPGCTEIEAGDTIISAMADFGDGQHELKVVVRGCELAVEPPAMGDALLPMALIAAMTRNQTLEMADPVSPLLLESVEQIQRIHNVWFPYLSMVDIKAPVFTGEVASPSGGAGKRAHFFSGGVDSLHSVYEDTASLDALVFVSGSDLIDCTPELHRETTQRLNASAAQFDLPLIYVDSNVREWATACGRHSDDFVSARLALITHLLGERFGEWVIASSQFGRIDPWFSHPMVDPLWSSERVRVLHPVPKRNRAEKTWDLARANYLENLRLCMWGEDFNCGVCRKCMRTLLTLKVLGVAERAPVFTKSPEISELLEKLSAAKGFGLELECQFLGETIDVAREGGVDPELIAELEDTLRDMEGRMVWERFEGAKNREAYLQSQWDSVPFKERRACFHKLLAINPEWLVKELAADLPAQKEAVFARLWKTERRWLKRRVRKASLERLGKKLGFGR